MNDLSFMARSAAARRRLWAPLPHVDVDAILAAYRMVYSSFDAESKAPKKTIPIQQIIAEVCEKYGVSACDIKSDRRTKNIMIPRHEIMWRARKETLLTLAQIGRALCRRDHSTVVNGITRHQERMDAGKVAP